MIEPMELQLNNLVLYEGQEVAIHELWNTDAILGDKAWSYVAPYKDLEPIPLTPELLERCGFVKEYDPEKDHRTEYWNSGNIKLTVYSGCVFFRPASLEVTSLHQLMNLIKTLTGKELKIK